MQLSELLIEPQIVAIIIVQKLYQIKIHLLAIPTPPPSLPALLVSPPVT